MSQHLASGVEMIMGLKAEVRGRLDFSAEVIFDQPCFILLKCMFFLRLKVARLDNIFLTRMHWSNVGGLCGEYVLEVRG